MVSLHYKDDEIDGTIVNEFANVQQAFAFAKSKYFNPSDDWYALGEEFMIDDYKTEYPEVKTIDDVADIDFSIFKKTGEFEWNDGRYIIATLKLKQ